LGCNGRNHRKDDRAEFGGGAYVDGQTGAGTWVQSAGSDYSARRSII
jgi:hypothetical protein